MRSTNGFRNCEGKLKELESSKNFFQDTLLTWFLSVETLKMMRKRNLRNRRPADQYRAYGFLQPN